MNDISRLLENTRTEGSEIVGKPTPAFWAVWRSEKSAMQAAGVKPRQINGSWSVRLTKGSDHYIRGAFETHDAGATFIEAERLQDVAGQKAAAEWASAQVLIPIPIEYSFEQLAIFAWMRVPSPVRALVVQARAGSGKTFTITQAIQEAPEKRIFYVCFNKKNQIEAAAKIRDPRVSCVTFHSIGLRIVKTFWPGVRADSFIEGDRIRQACPGIPDECVTQVARLVSFAKNTAVNPSIEELLEIAEARGVEPVENIEVSFPLDRMAKVARKVLDISKIKSPEGKISFDDMIWLPHAMGWIFPMADLVVVDEAQDMNMLQLTMARGVMDKGGRMVIVGDDRQAIYGFRGAASGGMQIMREQLGADQLGLTTTYRCPKSVVALAQGIVSDYKAHESNAEGIVDQILDDALVNKAQVGDAILSRANAPLMPVCLALIRRNVPARIEGRDIGKMLLTIVKKLKAKSVPNFIEKIYAWADKQKARAKSGKYAESRCQVIEDQLETLLAVADEASSVTDIENRLNNLFQDTSDASKPAVVLSSVHKAKGLEWNHIFVLRDTFHGGKRNGKEPSPEQAREEENIYYVAITRAKQQLTFVDREK